MVKGIIMS